MRPRFPQLSKFEIALSIGAILVVAICGFLTSRETTGLLLNTLWLALAVMCVSVPVAGVLGYCLSHCEVKWAGFWRSCLLVLLFVPLFIQLASWEAGFGRGGWYSTLIAQKLSYPPLEGFRGAVLIHALAAIPWLFGIFHLGFLAVPCAYLESASLDATSWQVFRRITLPMTLPVLLGAGLYVLIVTTTEITVTDRYQYRSYAEVLYNEFVLNDRFDELPLSIAPVLVTLVSVTLAGLVLCKLLWPLMANLTIDRERARRGMNWLATTIVASIVSLLLLIPVGNLIYQAGIDVVDGSGERVRSWSASKMLSLVANSPLRFREEIAYTAILAQSSVLLSLVMSTLLAWWARGRAWRQGPAALLATFCFVIPGPFIGLGLIRMFLFNRDVSPFLAWLYDDTLFVPTVAMTIRCFPFVYLIVWYGVSTIPKAVTDAASVDGASSLQTLWNIVLPTLWPSLICAGLVGLAVGIGELSASKLVMPPGVTTIATQIFYLIHYGAEDQLAGFCLSCLGIFVILGIVARVAFLGLVRR